jgi:hypothetical protein
MVRVKVKKRIDVRVAVQGAFVFFKRLCEKWKGSFRGFLRAVDSEFHAKGRRSKAGKGFCHHFLPYGYP